MIKPLHYIKILIILLFVFLVSCGSVRKPLLTEYSVSNGGDRAPAAFFENNRAYNLSSGDTVAFYKPNERDPMLNTKSTKSYINIGKPIDVVSGVSVPSIQIYKLPFWDIPGLDAFQFSMNNFSFYFDRTSSKADEYIYYYYTILNVGDSPIEEIVLVDALPKEFSVDGVEYWWTHYVAAAVFKGGGFDKTLWEIKEKDGIKYLIVKIVMEDTPLSSGFKPAISLRARGKININ